MQELNGLRKALVKQESFFLMEERMLLAEAAIHMMTGDWRCSVWLISGASVLKWPVGKAKQQDEYEFLLEPCKYVTQQFEMK